MRVLCVGRHPYLSEHFGRFFGSLGLDCMTCVGLAEAGELAPAYAPNVIICDYDILATIPLAAWERDPVLGGIPVLAVSLTRHPGDANLMDVNGVAGCLYLPTLQPDDALRVLSALAPKHDACRINPPNGLSWPATSSVPQPN